WSSAAVDALSVPACAQTSAQGTRMERGVKARAILMVMLFWFESLQSSRRSLPGSGAEILVAEPGRVVWPLHHVESEVGGFMTGVAGFRERVTGTHEPVTVLGLDAVPHLPH